MDSSTAISPYVPTQTTAVDTIAPQELRRLPQVPALTPEQMLYVRYRSRGHNAVKAAKAVGISTWTASQWESQPWFAEHCEALIKDIFGDRKDALEPLLLQALGVLEDVLTRGDLKEQMSAAQYILNQYYGRPPNRTEFGDKPLKVIVQSSIPRPEDG